MKKRISQKKSTDRDPLQELKRKLLQKKFILYIVFIVVIVTGISTFFGSLKNIKTFFDDFIGGSDKTINVQKQAALNLGINFSTLAFVGLLNQAESDLDDLDARIKGQLITLDIPISYPPDQSDYGTIRRLQEEIRSYLKKKDELLYLWYRYGFLVNGKVPLLEMIKMSIRDENEANFETVQSLKQALTDDIETIVKTEGDINLSSNFRERSKNIFQMLLSIEDYKSLEDLTSIQSNIVTFLDDISNSLK